MRFLTPCLLALFASCAATGGHSALAPETEASTELLASIAALEGTWQGGTAEAPMTVHFRSIAAGSVVHETMMPGTPMEMVNMYAVHGDGLNMTHYCGAGNQPHMRATSLSDGRMVFEPTGVSGRQTADEHYMAAMTLVLVDEDHIEQHWSSGDDPEAEPMVFELTRVR